MRGFSDITDTSFQMDFELLDLKTSGEVSAAPPPAGTVPIIGVQLCGADHATDRCGF